MTTDLIHVAQGAGAWAAWVTAGTTSAGWGRRRRCAFGGDRKDRELGFQPGGMALGALGLLLAVDEGFELVLALLADVLEDGHGRLRLLLESIYGEFANSGFSDPRFCRSGFQRSRFWRSRFWQAAGDGSGPVDSARAVPGSALAQWRPCADHRQLFAAAQDSFATCRGAAGRGRARN